MADLSHLTDEQLAEIATRGKTKAAPSKDLSAMSDEELRVIASSPVVEEPSTLEKVGHLLSERVGKPAAALGEKLLQPLTELDKVTAAPVRAGAGVFQEGGSLGDVGSAVADQFMTGLPSIQDGRVQAGELLETTPTSEEIAFRGIKGAGIRPEYAKTMAPLASIAVDIGLDPTNALPSEIVRDAGKGVARVARKALGGAAKAAGKAEMGVARAVANVGEFMTAGHLDAEKALKAYKDLNTRELLLPGGPAAKQGELLGALRQAFQERKITVPGSHEVAMEVRAVLENTRSRLIPSKAQNAQQVIDLIDARAFETKIVQDPPMVQVVDDGFGNLQEVVTPSQFREVKVPREMTLDELDDIIGNFDFITYTDKGFDRQLNRIWKPALKQSRAMMDEVLQTVPEGTLFKQEKSRFENLATAGKERGALFEWLGRAGKAGAILTMEPASLVMTAMQPSTYMQMLGALKLPRSVAEPVTAALQSGRPAMVREALMQIAERYPTYAERLVRASALVAAKPEGKQALTEDEAATLAERRIFDPEQVMAEKMRLQSDASIPSTERAKRLSEINERGYITLPAPVAKEERDPTPTQQVFGGQAGLDRLMQSLSRATN